MLTAPKNYNFADPCLECRREGDEIVISSRAFAKAVQIYSDDGDLLLDDNFFDMEMGEKRIKILSGGGEGIKLRSYFDVK